MIVKLFDKTEIYVTDEQADAVKQGVANNVPSIEVDGVWMKPSAIATIMPGGRPPANYAWQLGEDNSAPLIDRREPRGEQFAKAKAMRDKLMERVNVNKQH